VPSCDFDSGKLTSCCAPLPETFSFSLHSLSLVPMRSSSKDFSLSFSRPRPPPFSRLTASLSAHSGPVTPSAFSCFPFASTIRPLYFFRASPTRADSTETNGLVTWRSLRYRHVSRLLFPYSVSARAFLTHVRATGRSFSLFCSVCRSFFSSMATRPFVLVSLMSSNPSESPLPVGPAKVAEAPRPGLAFPSGSFPLVEALSTILGRSSTISTGPFSEE